jgi:hypothetical protein
MMKYMPKSMARGSRRADLRRAEHEGILVAQLGRAAARGSWRAAAWMLERQYPERWALPADPPAPEDADGVDALDELAERRRGRGP